LRAGHYWPWISEYFKGIAANKQGFDGQWLPWPPLNSRPAPEFQKFDGKYITAGLYPSTN
jgi:hypothetical protein